MSKGRFIGGVICLALAALLGILAVAVPDRVMYLVDGQNMPWLPPAVFGVVGIVLLATAGIGRQQVQATESVAPSVAAAVDPAKAALNKRLETIAFGTYLVAMGAYWLVPHTVVAQGVWAIVAGLVLLGLNGARYLNHMKMSGFTTFLGILSVIGGILQLLGLKVVEGAFLLILLGAILLVKPWFDKRQLFGKAEES